MQRDNLGLDNLQRWVAVWQRGCAVQTAQQQRSPQTCRPAAGNGCARAVGSHLCLPAPSWQVPGYGSLFSLTFATSWYLHMEAAQLHRPATLPLAFLAAS